MFLDPNWRGTSRAYSSAFKPPVSSCNGIIALRGDVASTIGGSWFARAPEIHTRKERG
jgi:hypothetical protein